VHPVTKQPRSGHATELVEDSLSDLPHPRSLKCIEVVGRSAFGVAL